MLANLAIVVFVYVCTRLLSLKFTAVWFGFSLTFGRLDLLCDLTFR